MTLMCITIKFRFCFWQQVGLQKLEGQISSSAREYNNCSYGAALTFLAEKSWGGWDNNFPWRGGHKTEGNYENTVLYLTNFQANKKIFLFVQLIFQIFESSRQ